MFRFTDGHLLIFDPPHLQEGFDGWYAIHGHVITIRDGGTRTIEGRYRVAFRIDGDTMTFHLLGRVHRTRSSSRRGRPRPSSERRERTLIRCPTASRPFDLLGSDQAVVTTSWGAVPAAPSFVA
jgi:hypothetical protein